MERQFLIRPVTVLKYKKFLMELSESILRNKKISLYDLAKQHQISTHVVKVLFKNKWIEYKEDTGNEKLDFCQDVFTVNDTISKKLIEEVRLDKSSIEDSKKQQLDDLISIVKGNVPAAEDQSKNVDEPVLKQKSLISHEIASVMGKVETALNTLALKSQTDIFDGINNVHNERVHIASAIASGVYTSEAFSIVDKDHIQRLNEKIIFATSDLMDKILNFKK